jgi:hypothetical protein
LLKTDKNCSEFELIFFFTFELFPHLLASKLKKHLVVTLCKVCFKKKHENIKLEKLLLTFILLTDIAALQNGTTSFERNLNIQKVSFNLFSILQIISQIISAILNKPRSLCKELVVRKVLFGVVLTYTIIETYEYKK